MRNYRFNPVALTIQTKGLSRILEKAVEEANRKESKSLKQRPSGNVIKMIAQASNGDLRCSINMLQFLAQQTSNSQTSVPYEDSVKGRGTKRKRNNVKSYSNSDAL